MLDLIAGTSTGAIITCALARPTPMPAERIAAVYEQDGPKIFDRSLVKTVTSVGGLLDELYSSDGLVSSLRRHLGTTRLAEATTRVKASSAALEATYAANLGVFT